MQAGIPTQLGSEKISRLLKQYAVPSIIAMSCSSLYNLVDSIFIGQFAGGYALAGLALTFPLMNLGTAFSSLIAVGASANIFIYLVQKNYSMAQKVLGNVVTLNFIIGILYMVGVLLFLDPILYFFGASEHTISHAREYMQIILGGNIISHTYFALNAVLRATGLPRKAMNASIYTVVINAVLDPLFIYLWGIRGAAIATIIAQSISLAWVIYVLSNRNHVVHFQKGGYKLVPAIVKRIVSVGMSPFFMNSTACLIVIVFNQGLKQYGGDLAIAAYGIVNKLTYLFIMIVMGLNQGMQPIASYNFGAKLYGRLENVVKQTAICAIAVTTFGFLIAEIFPRQLVMMFTSDEALINEAINGLRISFMFYPIVGFQMVTSNFFRSIGYAGTAIFLSLTRQLIFLLPLMLILPNFLQLNGIWTSMPLADLISCVVSASMMIYHLKKFRKQNLSDTAPAQQSQTN
ncbi:MAG: MATE family efflux transporter [Bacteroidales bacterium]|nr:MATE family efflux transporter [Bacteroidales bacterium]